MRYDYLFDFGDTRLILSGIGSLMDLRLAVKAVKRNYPSKARLITLQPFTMSPHTFCASCQRCPRCLQALHSCPGHD